MKRISNLKCNTWFEAEYGKYPNTIKTYSRHFIIFLLLQKKGLSKGNFFIAYDKDYKLGWPRFAVISLSLIHI